MAQAVPLVAGFTQAGACKICRGPAYLFDVVDFNKYTAPEPYAFGLSGIPVYYKRCLDCGFVFTEHFDGWDTSRFSNIIYNRDYAKVDLEYSGERALRVADMFAGRWPNASRASILDYGSGSGMFSRRLKALGFDNITDYDPFSSPSRPAGPFDIITSTEVMEHSADPQGTMRDIQTFAQPNTVVLFTTLLQPDDIEDTRADWWYIAPRNGHISIYSDGALDVLAAAHGCWYLPGDNFHAFARQLESDLLESYRPRFGITVYAPERARTGDTPGWNAIEDHKRGEIRWSARSRIPLPFMPGIFPCSVYFRMPIAMEVVAGFAAQCVVEYGEVRSALSVTPLAHCRCLVGCIEMSAPGAELVLVTPEPLKRKKDGREIGLAVPLRIGGQGNVVSARSPASPVPATSR